MRTLRQDRDAVEQTFHALGDEKRLAVLKRLVSGERCVCELADEAGIGQSLLSFHLRVLKDAGLVRVRRVGRWGFYSVDVDTVGRLQSFLGDLGGAVIEGTRCCADPGCRCSSS